MITLPFLLPLALLQVGPNPGAADALALPDELANRPERPRDPGQPLLKDPASAWLAECLALIESDPARAHSTAQIRRNETSGAERVLANHCLGLAATDLGLWDDARAAFIAARDDIPEDEPRAKARSGIMAGNAAMAGGDPATAERLLATAQGHAQAAASATLQAAAAVDLARVLVALNRPEEALTSLETAIQLIPSQSEPWLLKATLLRRLKRLGEAQAAIEEAVALSPQEVEIGLEAGVIAVLSGRDGAARASWQSVIDTQPDSLAAETAKDYLAQIGPAPERPQEASNP